MIDTQGYAHIAFRDPYGDYGDPEILYVTNTDGGFGAPVGISEREGFVPWLDFDREGYLPIVVRNF